MYQAVLEAQDLAALCKEAQKVVLSLGFDHFMFILTHAEVSTVESASIFSIGTYPHEWIKRYKEKRYFLVDPTAIHVRQHNYPIAWRNDTFSTPEALAMYAEAKKFGISAGGTCPVSKGRAPSGFGFARNQDADEGYADSWRALPCAHMLGAFVHERVADLLGEAHSDQERLTPREKECLLWAAKGLRDYEIAEKLFISTRTVVFHMVNARTKLGADNRSQVIARAIALGIILL